MKESQMDTRWRTVQIFLSDDGISETQISSDDESRVRCSCNTFVEESTCKHQIYVQKRLDKNNGNYSIVIPSHIPDEEMPNAESSPVEFREFVLKYGTIEVL